MKKHDVILIVVILVIAGGWFGYMQMSGNGDAGTVVVTVDGEVYGEYDLTKDQTVSIHDTNVLTIKDKTADMTEADCPDKLCVHQKAISRDGESIICLPNKVVVSVVSGQAREYDAVVK
ncbi:NusG domain II-containing protein [Hespellia stercorisuis]|uniref:Uncharacterized protein n=1 Tax=Hespellia stercorisuis DSM 15480 TaxID=1121950 RepID=A0A1M6HH51_9FIRM|nr:NusG domain II-containing protein [Hespellia stercorisuis]SHJ21556.1 hypothetical protein SAMN02745243_00020 [Hespellia stercorisuis DSM 15480]